MPTQRDVERLQALKEADRRGMLGTVQKSALSELERRFMQFAEPAMTAASAAVAEPVSGFVGLAALPYGSDVATQAIERTQQAMTYQPRTEAGLQGLQALQNVMAPVGEAFEGASSYLGDAAYEATGSPALGAAAYSVPTAALELLGANIARRLPGRKLEFGDIGKRPMAGKQRGAVGGITSKADDAPKTQRLYHASDVEFDQFDPARVGDRMTALGLGHYLTPNLEKAKQYGKNVMEFDVDMGDVLDFDNLKAPELKKLSDELMAVVPERVLSGYGERKFKVVPKTKEGMAEFRRMQKQMADLKHDRAKPKVLSKSEIPDDLSVGPNEVAIQYMEPPKDLTNLRPEDIVALMQEYNQVIPKRLGYKGAKFGDEIAIYDPNLATRAKD